jgi:hypothetical protein
LLFIAIYPLTLYKALLGHNIEGRPMHWMYLAAPAVIGITWQAVVNSSGEVFTVLFMGSLAMVPMMCYGIWPLR